LPHVPAGCLSDGGRCPCPQFLDERRASLAVAGVQVGPGLGSAPASAGFAGLPVAGVGQGRVLAFVTDSHRRASLGVWG
jgi:hypothetical protein